MSYSRSVTDTRRRILDTARELFNASGLHRVGVRDIARATGMSPGNLAYHFPTKDDLVAALVLELHERGAGTTFAEPPVDFSLVSLYHAAVTAMRGMLAYRFILVSYVDAVMSSPDLQQLEASLWTERRRGYDAMMERLCRGGYVRRRAFAARAAYLYEQGEMISSGWLVAATLHAGPRDDQASLLHYAKVGCALLQGYVTPRGARQLSRILAGAYDGVA
jgi:AcrR family transcriptional regulator